MERVIFYNSENLKHKAIELYNYQRQRIENLLPNADIQHVGSTAIPYSLTKGDLDIQVRVSAFLWLLRHFQYFMKLMRAVSKQGTLELSKMILFLRP